MKRFIAVVLSVVLLINSVVFTNVLKAEEDVNTDEDTSVEIAETDETGEEEPENIDEPDDVIDDQQDIIIEEEDTVELNDTGNRSVLASGSCGDDATYTIYDDYSLVVSGSGAMQNFTSPDGSPWYKEYHNNFTSIIIESGITSIGNYSFYFCSNATSLNIANTVKSIGDYSCFGCFSLTDIVIPDSVKTIGECAFQSCLDLTALTIPDSVTSVGGFAFSRCKSMTSLTIGNSLTNIQHNTFEDCNSLTSVIIPSTVSNVDYSAFNGCTQLTDIIFEHEADDTLSIQENAFINSSDTSIATSVYVPDNNNVNSVISGYDWASSNREITYKKIEAPKTILETGSCGDNATYTIYDDYSMVISGSGDMDDYRYTSSPWNSYRNDIKKIVIEEGITSVGKNAFPMFSSLTSVVLPDSLTRTGESAFEGCFSLTSIYIPKSLVSIEYLAFNCCDSLIEIIVSEENPRFDSRDNCNAIIETETNTLFYGCKNSIIPDSVTSIGDDAFGGCHNLSSILIPDSVTSIGDHAFYDCSLKFVLIPNSVKIIADDGFSMTENTYIAYVPDTVEIIGDSAFDGATDIYTNASEKQTGWDDSWCYEETKVHYGVSVDLYNELINDPSVISIGKCGDNLQYRIYDDNTMVISGTGEMYDTDLLLDSGWFSNNLMNVTSIVFEEGVTSIGGGAFEGGEEGQSKLETVVIPDTVTRIGYHAFCHSVNLTTINIPDSVKYIDEYAFNECGNLVIDVIPETITHIGEYAFSGIGSETIFVPKSVVEIDNNAFANINDIYTDASGKMPLWGEMWYGDGTVHYNTTLEEYRGQSYYQYGDIVASDIDLYEQLGRPLGLWTSELKHGYSSGEITYTGKPITVSFRVYYGNKLLKENTDYSVKYANNTKAGTATITITGKGNYKDTAIKQFTISPIKIDENNTIVTLNKDAFLFNNKKQKATVASVESNGVKLKNNTDYTVYYENENSVNEGTYQIQIIGKGNYTGDLYKTYLISRSIKPVSSLKISGIKNLAYSGNSLKQEIVIKDGKSVLVEGQDYHVEYRNNINAGTAYAQIIGDGDYAGSVTKSFKITPITLSKKNVTIEGLPSSLNYSGEVKPRTSLLFNGVKLIEGRDYTVTFKNNNKAGNATISYKGTGNYSGTVNASFTINKLSIEHSNIYMDDSHEYVKGGVKPEPVIIVDGRLLELNKDYTLAYKNNNEYSYSYSQNRPTITIKGKGNYNGSVTRVFNITSKYLSDVDMTIPDKTYTGKANGWKSNPVLTDTNGSKLAAGKDYSNKLSYFNIDGITYATGNEYYNDFLYTYEDDSYALDGSQKTKPVVFRKAGDAVKKTDIPLAGTTIKVTVNSVITYKNIKNVSGYTQRVAIRNYIGSASATYRIVEADISKAKVTIPVKYYTGRPVTLYKDDIDIWIGNDVVWPNEYEIISYANNINKGTAKVTIKGKGRYGGTKSVNFTIKQRSFNDMP